MNRRGANAARDQTIAPKVRRYKGAQAVARIVALAAVADCVDQIAAAPEFATLIDF